MTQENAHSNKLFWKNCVSSGKPSPQAVKTQHLVVFWHTQRPEAPVEPHAPLWSTRTHWAHWEEICIQEIIDYDGLMRDSCPIFPIDNHQTCYANAAMNITGNDPVLGNNISQLTSQLKSTLPGWLQLYKSLLLTPKLSPCIRVSFSIRLREQCNQSQAPIQILSPHVVEWHNVLFYCIKPW